MDSEPVGIVLVHGIGEQEEGDTLDKFLRGVQSGLYSSDVQRLDLSHAIVRLPDHQLRIYEAWWAREFRPEQVAGSFDARSINVLAWFPWLNLRYGCYPNRPIVRSLLWTAVLGPLAVLLQVAGFIIAVVLKLVGRAPGVLGDQVLADVNNYVSSAARATRPSSPLRDAADRIQRRFADALDEAAADGCTRVVVVAHSLGTVVAYHGLTGLLSTIGDGPPRPQASPAARDLVSDFITIGSPLEKIRFIWPGLVAAPPLGGPSAGTVHWHNMRDRLDLVSGRLRHTGTWGEVDDHPLLGRAWLKNAHTAYEQNPAFHRLLLQAVDAHGVAVRPTPVLTRLRLFAASVLLNLAVVIGLAVLIAIAVIVPAVLVVVVAAIIAVRAAAESGATGSQFSDLLDSGFHAMLIALPILFGLVVPLGWGRLAAGFEHYRYRHARWLDPAVLSDESVGPRARLKHAANDPQRWWNRSLVGSRGRMAVVVMLLATVPVGAGIWFLAGFPNPFDAERSWGTRAAISGGAVALGLGAELVTFVVVGLIALTVGGLYGTWHAYRRWVYATNTPPPS